MSSIQRRAANAARCTVSPSLWRLCVLVVIEAAAVVLVVAGYDVQTALACATGAALATAGVTAGVVGQPPGTPAQPPAMPAPNQGA
ncbi:hypothetical protein GPA10_39250 [Streptomyces sp. p1417]|uniref:Uncharacterized protein n=1 Tax=Streptomyces typhae TaxID=2681492 RepID=A0A6L6XAY5_9ACTN|nr:hypothetical protein [Streptomyces typhae]MVO90630.1 hypothetical protein [Streptomyces typhae]